MNKSGYIIFLILIMISVFINFSYAGNIYIEEQVSGNITGNNISDIRRIIIKDDKILLVDPSLVYRTLFNLKENKVFLIDDLNRRYAVTGMNELKVPVKEKFITVFASFGKSSVVYKESGNKRMIGGYDCFEVVVFLPRAAAIINLWLTKSIEAPLEIYFNFLEKAKVENSQITHIVNIMKEYKAYPAECTITMVAEKAENKIFNMVLKEFSAREVPDSEFLIPEEYSRFVVK
ncbi:MAG: hypothetical protein MUC95_03545 [Spirochaetes bacterium]|jgi:hypothetical protein|nr:hypothetical protein [Spirochaetota bacterium]